ncbi:hypothetical protein GCM10027596_26150 [Nocardioides korecus]
MRLPTSLLVVLTALLAALTGTLALTSSADAAARRLLTYRGSDGTGVYLTSTTQVDRRLPGSPADFRRFVKRRVTYLRGLDECAGSARGLTVWRVRTDGFASGAENACGGALLIWKRVSGRWRMVTGTQSGWPCGDLRRWSVPSSMIPGPGPKECWTGARFVTYRHA